QWMDKKLDIQAVLEEVVISADEHLLDQVWLNLIHNAVKFTPLGGRITVHLERRDDRAVVTVSDTGPGIAEEDQPRIFERFYKADKSRHRAAGGSGLGLSIAKKIVEIHRGRSVQPAGGRGGFHRGAPSPISCTGEKMLKRRLAFGSRVGTYRLLRNCGPSDEEKEIGRRAPLTADISQISETGRRFSASNPCRWGEGGKSLPPGALRP